MPCYQCQTDKNLTHFQYQAGTAKQNSHIRVQKAIIDLQLCDRCIKKQKKTNRKQVFFRILMAFAVIGVLTLFIQLTQFHRLMGLYPFILLFTFLSLLDKLGSDRASVALHIVNSKNYSPDYPVLYEPEKLKRMSAAQFFAVDIEFIDN